MLLVLTGLNPHSFPLGHQGEGKNLPFAPEGTRASEAPHAGDARNITTFLNPLSFPLEHQGGGIHRKVDFVRRRASFQPAMRRMRSLWDMSGS